MYIYVFCTDLDGRWSVEILSLVQGSRKPYPQAACGPSDVIVLPVSS